MKFPSDVRAARYFSVAVRDSPKQIVILSDKIGPTNQKKTRLSENRTTEIQIDFGNPVIPEFGYLKRDARAFCVFGRIDSPIMTRSCILQPKEATLTTYYETAKHKKLLHSFFVQNSHPPVDIGWVLVNCDEFYAIDTNTVQISQGVSVSATAVVKGTAKRLPNGRSMVDMKFSYAEANIGVRGNPELFAISRLICRLRSAEKFESGRRIGILTDTEYSKLKDINFRREPLFENVYLPDNFQLLYATSDTGATEYVPNKMMRMCDKAAGEAARKAISNLPNGVVFGLS